MNIIRFLPRFREISAALQQYEQRESWTQSDLQEYQLERINTVWTHARCNVPYYRNLQLPDAFASLSEYSHLMPVLKKATVRDQPDQFLSRQAAAGSWHRSGGSTGKPTSFYWEHESHREVLRAKYRCEQAHGIDVFDRKVFLWGHTGSLGNGWKGRTAQWRQSLFDTLRGRTRLSAYDLDDASLESMLGRIRRSNARSLYGYSSAIDLLANAALDQQEQFPDLSLVIMTSEPADKSMRDRVSAVFQCPTVIEYGAAECNVIAYTMPDGKLRTRDDVVMVETTPNAVGTHDVLLTLLSNKSFPLLRYAIEDTTSAPIDRQGPGFGTLSDIRGRANDVLVGRSGSVVHPMLVKHVVEVIPRIRRFRAHQHETGDLNLTIEAGESVSTKNLESVRVSLQSVLEGYPVRIETVDRIPGNLAGKHRWVICDMVNHRATG
ncbi:MAG: hypothetical protein AAFP90_15870 [Planctomycetota bacterium]